MKKLFIISFLLYSVCLSTLGQSIDRDRFQLVYLKFPMHPLPLDAETYSIQLNGEKDILNELNQVFAQADNTSLQNMMVYNRPVGKINSFPELTEAYLDLPVYRIVEENGDFKINLNFGNFLIVNKTLKQTSIKCKKEGVETTCPSHYYELEYTYPIEMEIIGKGNLKIYNTHLNSTSTKLKTAFGNNHFGNFKSEAELSSIYNHNKESIYKELQKGEIIHALIRTRKIIENNCMFKEEKRVVMLASAKRKYDYSDLNAARTEATNALKTLNGTLPYENTISEVKAAIEKWKTILTQLDVNDRKARIDEKIGSYIYYNLATSCFYIEELDKAKEFIDIGLKLKGANQQLREIKTEIEKRIKSKSNNRNITVEKIEPKIMKMNNSLSNRKTVTKVHLSSTIHKVSPWVAELPPKEEPTQAAATSTKSVTGTITQKPSQDLSDDTDLESAQDQSTTGESFDQNKDWLEKIPKMIFEDNSHADLKLSNIFFTDENNGFATGNYNTVCITTDGGNNWKVTETTFDGIKTFDRKSYSDICFYDKKNGYGYKLVDTKIFYTSDEGQTWEKEINIPNRYGKKICFVNQLKGWIVDISSVYSTNDGGNTWSEEKFDCIFLTAINFINEQQGWIAGNHNRGMILYSTKNGGETWEKQFLPETNSVERPLKICFNKNIGWICSVINSLLFTTNGGVTWKKIKNMSALTTNFDDIAIAPNGTIGMVAHIGIPGNSFIYYSKDEGKSWNKDELKNVDDVIYSIGFSKANVPFIAGSGLYMKTSKY